MYAQMMRDELGVHGRDYILDGMIRRTHAALRKQYDIPLVVAPAPSTVHLLFCLCMCLWLRCISLCPARLV